MAPSIITEHSAPDPGADVVIVATHRRWIADDLAAANYVPVVSDPCLDAPVLPTGTRAAWWTPGEHAALLMASGVNLTFRSAGPDWLPRIPADLLGRTIWSGTITDLETSPDAPRHGWCKPAESKIATLPAGWYDDIDAFRVAMALNNLPTSIPLHISPTWLDITDEYRCFITYGQVTATGAYLHAGNTWDPDWDTQPDPLAATAAAFAQHVLDTMGQDQPPGFTLDVGLLADGRWVVIEANASWSSNIYGCTPRTGVLDSIIASSVGDDWLPHGTRVVQPWQWFPDPYQLARTVTRPFLRRSFPAWTIPTLPGI